MQVMTPTGLWKSVEDFNAGASIRSLIELLIEEMELKKGDFFQMVDASGNAIDPSTEIGLVCDSYLELIATGSAV